MKKLLWLVAIGMLFTVFSTGQAEAKVTREPGGLPAFFIGCCWGLREGSEWNEGADMHWREWCRIIPYAGIVFAIWDGVECYGGITAHEWAEKNGANWY